MNPKNYLIETIFSLNPIDDIYKAINFSKILFSAYTIKDKDFSQEIALLIELENNVVEKIPLKICYELYYKYKDYSPDFVINHKSKSGKIIKLPLYDLRESMRKLYFAVVEIIYNSGLMGFSFDIGESGNLGYSGSEQ